MKTDMTLSIRDFTPALENTWGGQDIFCGSHIKLKQIFFISENTAALIMLSCQYIVPLHPFRKVLLAKAVDILVLFTDVFEHFQS